MMSLVRLETQDQSQLDVGCLAQVASCSENHRENGGDVVGVADGFDDFERAMRRKLERELAPPAIGALPQVENAG